MLKFLAVAVAFSVFLIANITALAGEIVQFTPRVKATCSTLLTGSNAVAELKQFPLVGRFAPPRVEGWATRINCNNGALIIETENGDPTRVQMKINDPGLVNYFAEAADQFMFYKMRGHAQWSVGLFKYEGTLESIDFGRDIVAGGRDPLVHTSFKIAREGNGVHVNLFRVDTWGESPEYGGFTPKKTETFLRTWYFENCFN